MMPTMLAEITGNLHVAAAALAAAVGIGLLGSKAAEATGRNPGAAGNILTLSIILAALIEGIVFFAIFLAK
jgi:F-type H+-transporting ATPase subunit c